LDRCPALAEPAGVLAGGPVGLSVRADEVFRPDFYVLFDMNACAKYRDAAKAAQAAGTKLVTLAKSPESLKQRGVDHFDIFLELGGHRGTGPFPLFRPGEYADCGFSRLYALQFAINNGATHVLLLGMKGYPHKRGEEGYTKLQAIADFVGSCLRQCPGVRFTFCARPRYELPPTDNYRVFDTPEQFTEEYSLCESN